MERAELSLTDDARVPSLTRIVEGLGPRAVLRRGAGEVRGFWARGERWVAHLGSVATLEEPAGSDDRFRLIWRRGRALLESVEPASVQGGASSRPPRLYGGFSFRPDLDPDPFWESFPAASFVLPAVEVVGDGKEARVSLRGAAEVGSDGEESAWAELRERLEELVREMLEAEGDADDSGSSASPPRSLTETEREAWERAVGEAVESIEHGAVEKVVLARTLDVALAEAADPVRAVMNLWRENPGTHVFLYEPAAGAALVGAAPETVATVSEGRFRATAVAGSIGRGRSPEEQEALALRLLESEKDREEHEIAVRDMVSRLDPLADELSWDSEPHVLTLSRIQHLETRIQATLRDDEHALSALEALHPTPAVCGLPRDAALEFLRVEEPFERGWYAGPVGWFDAAGDGLFAPALRCAVSRGSAWRLFAGAGIVRASVPAREWEETRIKFQPALRALDAGSGG